MNAHEVAAESIAWMRTQPQWVAVGAVFGAAVIEYVIPPIPGDVVVLAAGVLVGQGILDAPAVIGVVTVGATIGTVLAWGIGRFASTNPRARRLLLRMFAEKKFEAAAERYRRWGRLLLVLNRFLLGVRSSLLFASGLFRVRGRDVAIFGALSALLWNSLLVAAGALAGARLDELIDAVERYSTVGWTLLATVVAALLVRSLVKRVRARRRAAP